MIAETYYLILRNVDDLKLINLSDRHTNTITIITHKIDTCGEINHDRYYRQVILVNIVRFSNILASIYGVTRSIADNSRSACITAYVPTDYVFPVSFPERLICSWLENQKFRLHCWHLQGSGASIMSTLLIIFFVKNIISNVAFIISYESSEHSINRKCYLSVHKRLLQ